MDRKWLVAVSLIIVLAVAGCCTSVGTGDVDDTTAGMEDEGNDVYKVLTVDLVFDGEPVEGAEYWVRIRPKDGYASLGTAADEPHQYQAVFYNVNMTNMSQYQDLELQVLPCDENGINYDAPVSAVYDLTFTDGAFAEGDYLEVPIN